MALAFSNSPAAFRRLPRDMRTKKARTVLGPSGAWWLKDRVDGVVEALTSHQVRGVVARGSGVRLLLDGPRQTTLDVDHVIAATGFRVDISRLPFLNEPVVAGIATLDGFPDLSRAGESTVPGLYFAGAAAAGSLGPSARFIAGTHTSVAPLTHSLARSLGADAASPSQHRSALRQLRDEGCPSCAKTPRQSGSVCQGPCG